MKNKFSLIAAVAMLMSVSLGCFFATSSTTVRGYVEYDNKPIEGATVKFGPTGGETTATTGGDGKFTPVITMEYRDLVEEETLIGPLEKAGEYELVAQFSVCAYPGEKYCARIQLSQPIFVVEGSGAPAEVPLPVDLKTIAESTSAEGSGSNGNP